MTPNSPVQSAIQSALDGRSLSVEEMSTVAGCLMDGQASEALIASFLTALRAKGESVEELVGAARVMRERVTPISVATRPLLDTCGTGGDRLKTFNISTATAIVASSCGLRVAKHGNRSVSSSSGSADVLEALGVRIDLTADQVASCVEQIGIGFCFAPLLHGAMKHVAPVRRQLGFRTIFNLLGPLTNPAGAEFQLIGAHDPTLAAKMAQALSHLGSRHAIVVCGASSLDEVSLWGETTVFEVRGDVVRSLKWNADSFELPQCHVEALQVESPKQSASTIERILEGEKGPARDIVVANTAAALVACEAMTELPAAARKAEAAIDSGSSLEKLKSLRELSQNMAMG